MTYQGSLMIEEGERPSHCPNDSAPLPPDNGYASGAPHDASSAKSITKSQVDGGIWRCRVLRCVQNRYHFCEHFIYNTEEITISH